MNEYLAVMTVQGTVDGINHRAQTRTAISTFNGYTRAGIFDWMKKQFPPELAALPVVFFSVEPNQLGGPS
jgi:hypothetical protein